MADDLVIHFRGLCAYLLHGKDSGGQEKNATVLLLADSMHTPRITIQLQDLVNDSDLARFPNNNGVIGWLELPSQCDISVKPEGTKAKISALNLKGATGKKSGCPDLLDKHALAWLPDLNALGGKKSLPTLLDTAPKPFPPEVVARFLLTQGDLQCKGHALDQKVVQTFQFPSAKAGALASVVQYSLDRVGKFVDLVFDRGGATEFSLSLLPPAEVVITHLPDPSHPPNFPGHFMAFYQLLEAGAATPLPTLAGNCGPSLLLEDIRNEPRRPCPQGMLRA